MKSHYILKASLLVVAFAARTLLAQGEGMMFKVSADRQNAIYRCGETATFTVRAVWDDGQPVSSGKVTAVLDEFGTNTLATETFDISKSNPFSVKGSLDKPGFLQLQLSGEGFRHTRFGVGYEPERLEKGSPTPPDFREFWEKAVRRLDATVPPDPRLELVKERSAGAFNFWRISFATWGGARVYGYLSMPKDASATKRYPVRIQVPGAGKGAWTNNMAGAPDAICMLLTVHDFAPPFDLSALRKRHDALSQTLSARYGTPYYDLAGIAKSREEYYFYRVILGANRAVNWLASRPEADLSSFTYSGTSQGGGFGFYLLGLNRHFTRGVMYVPALTDIMGYRAGRRSGWPRLIEQQSPENRKAAEGNAPYFDGANFAPYITCPVRVVVGFADYTCPPHAVYAAYNAIASKDKRIFTGIGMTHSCRKAFYDALGAWQAGGPPMEPIGFGCGYAWAPVNYKDRIFSIAAEASSDGSDVILEVRGPQTKCDTAWRAVSERIAIPPSSRAFRLSVEARCSRPVIDQGESGEGWNNAIAWYGVDGRKVSAQAIPQMVFGVSRQFRHIIADGTVPDGAAACTVQFGFDVPNLGKGECAEYRNAMLSFGREPLAGAGTNRDALVEALYAQDAPPPKATLRDDGMTLIDGKPFFPIGMYSVCRREFNGDNLDRAFAGLKDAGFNFAHTYGDSYDPEFLSAARRHGFKLWVQARMPDEKFLSVGRHDPSILAWYLGDDTATHITPQELKAYNAAVKAVDPFRLTCQADGLHAELPVSRYAAYVRWTDVFMPEIYPVRNGEGDVSDRTCVASVIRDMKRCVEDMRRFGDGRPHGLWPIIQYFKGWGDWGHFPTREQLFAMTWASLIHGANGITWYTYGGRTDPAKGLHNAGVTSTPERWKAISDLATQIRHWSPVLLERTPREQPMVTIVEGPAQDPLGLGPSVTALMKRHEGRSHIFAVNASPEPVTARIAISGSDTITERFAPFGVLAR